MGRLRPRRTACKTATGAVEQPGQLRADHLSQLRRRELLGQQDVHGAVDKDLRARKGRQWIVKHGQITAVHAAPLDAAAHTVRSPLVIGFVAASAGGSRVE